MNSGRIPVFDIPADPAFWQEPASIFLDALATGHSVFSTSSGGFSILGYDALTALGRDPRVEGAPFGPDGMGPDNPDISALLRWGLFAMGRPAHMPLRRAVIAGLSAQRVDAMRPLITAIATELADRLHAKGEADLVTDFVFAMTSRVFCALSGLSDTDAPAVEAAISAIAKQLNTPDEQTAAVANREARWLLDRLARLEAEKRSPLLADIAAHLPEDSEATAAELVAAFVFDGVETAGSGLVCVLDCLMRQPGFTEPPLGNAVQEAFRLTTPTMLTVRIAKEELAWEGIEIPAGSPLFMWWPGGNLDERVFTDPLRFNPDRPIRRHLAFGVGAHGCLGRQLSSIIAEESAKALLLSARRARPLGSRTYQSRLSRLPEAAPVVFG